jgi:hypothetical protein
MSCLVLSCAVLKCLGGGGGVYPARALALPSKFSVTYSLKTNIVVAWTAALRLLFCSIIFLEDETETKARDKGKLKNKDKIGKTKRTNKDECKDRDNDNDNDNDKKQGLTPSLRRRRRNKVVDLFHCSLHFDSRRQDTDEGYAFVRQDKNKYKGSEADKTTISLQ